MPYKRNYRRRRYGRKRAYRRKWRRGYRRNTNDGKRFFKIRATSDIASSAGGIITIAATDNPSSYTDFTSGIATMFDEYRVCAIKIKFIPGLPNDTSVTTGYKPMYLVHDKDSASNPLTSSADAIGYENMRVKNMYMPWKHYVKCSRVIRDGAIKQGYRGVSITSATQGIYGWGDGFDISQSYGTMIYTLYVCAINRR